MGPETEPEAQLRLFPLDPPKRMKGQRRVVPTYSDEQRAAFRRTEEVNAGIRPSWLPGNRKLCAGCGKVIYRDLRNCGRRWCPLVRRTWLRDREAVIRRALQEHGGHSWSLRSPRPISPAGWDCDGAGHRGLPCSGVRGCKVKTEVVERENELFSKAASRTAKSRAHVGAEGNEASRIRGSGISMHPRPDNRAAIARPRSWTHSAGPCDQGQKAFARFFVDGLARFGAAHGLGFVDRYNHALWKQRDYQGPGQAERAAR